MTTEIENTSVFVQEYNCYFHGNINFRTASHWKSAQTKVHWKVLATVASRWWGLPSYYGHLFTWHNRVISYRQGFADMLSTELHQRYVQCTRHSECVHEQNWVEPHEPKGAWVRQTPVGVQCSTVEKARCAPFWTLPVACCWCESWTKMWPMRYPYKSNFTVKIVVIAKRTAVQSAPARLVLCRSWMSRGSLSTRCPTSDNFSSSSTTLTFRENLPAWKSNGVLEWPCRYFIHNSVSNSSP